MKVYFKGGVVAGFCLALVIITALGIYSYLSIQQLIDTANALSRSLRVTNLAERVLVTTIDLETGQRGFVITGDTRYLEPYKNARKVIDTNIDQLLSVTADQPVQNQMVLELKEWLTKKSEIVEVTVKARQTNFDSALSIVKKGTGKETMDSIRAIISDIQAHEAYAFSRQTELTSGSVLRQFQISFIGLLIVPAIVIVILFYNINRNLYLREATEAWLHKATNDTLLANKELESFTYSVSHDLRAPLRSVNSYAEILREDYGDKLDDEALKTIDIIIRNGKRMGQLIDDLLDFSRLGRKELTKSKVSVDVMVNEVVTELRESMPSAPNTQIKVLPLPPAVADSSMLRQVWSNLISNAVKYSSKVSEPMVEIGTGEKDGVSYYYVKDNGVGFSMDYVHKLFNVFQRLHKMEEFEGTGVGLALTKRIISRHGGTIWVDAAINKGATFYFSLPNSQL